MGRRRRRREEEEEEEIKPRSRGMELWIFVWKLNSSMDLLNSKAWFS